jgi:hypothetical protein
VSVGAGSAVNRRGFPSVSELCRAVRRNYFRLYLNFVYFNIDRIVYLQTDVIFSLHPARTKDYRRQDHTRLDEPDPECLHTGQNLVSVSCQLPEHDLRADFDLSAVTQL